MNKKLLFSLFLILGISSQSVFTQTSQGILDDLSAKSKAYTSVYAEYEAKLVDIKNGIDQTQSGKIKIKDNKYNLDIANYKVISDGVNIWTFDKETNTCAIDLLEDMDEDVFDPAKVLTIWENDFKHEYKGEVTENGKTLYHINLYPTDPAEKPFHTVELYVDKAKMEVVRILAKGRDGADTIYNMKKFSANMQMGASDFMFDPTDYPGVEMEDNRM